MKITFSWIQGNGYKIGGAINKTRIVIGCDSKEGRDRVQVCLTIRENTYTEPRMFHNLVSSTTAFLTTLGFKAEVDTLPSLPHVYVEVQDKEMQDYLATRITDAVNSGIIYAT
jgi:hypothetical protein